MKDKVSNKNLSWSLKNEGESYAILHYYGKTFEAEDLEAKKLWDEAYDSLVKLKEYLKQNVSDEDMDDF